MQLTSDDLYLLCQCAISSAQLAGRLISEYTGKELNIKHKTSGSGLASQVVTEVDQLSQELILENLKKSIKIYNLGLLAEETDDDNGRFIKDYFWCIDPLDGTLPFTEGKEGYSVSIALVSKEGIPYIGVIYDPIKNNLYSAIKGEGAYKNGLQWDPLANKSTTELTLVCDRSFVMHSDYDKLLDQIDKVVGALGLQEIKLIQQGGAAMNACWVLENTPACYFKLPKKEEGGGSLWDFAATACIFNECGAIATDIYNNPLDLNRQDSTFMNHRGVIYASNKEIAEKLKSI